VESQLDYKGSQDVSEDKSNNNDGTSMSNHFISMQSILSLRFTLW